MTFLQLCQFVQSQLGASVDLPWAGPTATTNQSGQYLEIVNWVNMAYKAIQIEQPDWYWRWKQGTLVTTVAQDTYTLAQIQAQITDFEYPKDLHFINDVRYTLVYDTTSGVGDETFCYFYNYQNWRGWRDRSIKPAGKPAYYTFRPDATLEISHVPTIGNGSGYTIVLDYRPAVDVLSGDSASPATMPAQYHEAIAWYAVMYWAKQRKDQATYSAAKMDYDRIMNRMRMEQLPETEFYLGEYY